MRIEVDESAIARQPQKAATRDRFEGILREAEALLLEHGINGFSIPILADRLGYTRASIYRFFPTPYSVLNELSSRHFEDLTQRIRGLASECADMAWQDLLAELIRFAASYFNDRPAARLLMLGGALTDLSFSVQEQTNQSLGQVIRTQLAAHGLDLPEEPDRAWIAVGIVDGVLRHSQFRYGRVTAACCDEAVRAMVSYLSPPADRPRAGAVSAPATPSAPRSAGSPPP
jgi:AcrR family transcriptional regulator